MKTTFFIKDENGSIDYFEVQGIPDKYAALEEYILKHYDAEAIHGLEVYETVKLKKKIKFELVDAV